MTGRTKYAIMKEDYVLSFFEVILLEENSYYDDKLFGYQIIRRNAHVIGLTGLIEYGYSFIMLLPMWILWMISNAVHSDFLYQLSELVVYLLVLLVPFMIAARVRHISFSDMVGRGKPDLSVYIMTIFLCLAISVAASYAGGLIEAGLNGFGLSEPPDAYVMPVGTAAVVTQFLSIAVAPPIVEELCFRGFVLREASKSLGTWGAIWVSALIFCGIHESFTVVPLALGFGLLGGFLREKYGSLLPAIAGHFTVNALYFFINYFTDSMPEAQALPVVTMVDAACLLLGAVGVLMFFARDEFEIDRLCGFTRPGLYGKGAALRGYLTSVPLLCLIALLVFRTFYNLNWIG